jgi:hypothetical protein
MKAARLLVGALLALLASGVWAEPYLAVRAELKCVACHVNPTGGGLRNAAGNAYAQFVLPAHGLPSVLQGWRGFMFDDRLRLGGDWRSATTRTAVAGQPTLSVRGTEHLRLYADVQLVKEYLGAYLDQRVAPGKSERQEAYLRFSTPGLGLYAKAGQFYLPFGWRLQDNLSFVRQLSGVSMTVPDKGVELGHESDQWSLQLVRSNGPGNRGGVNGHQTTAQATWMQAWGRLGAAAAKVKSSAGDRQAWGLFAGTTTGPVAWLAEIDWVSDAGYPEGTRRQLATLLEANWLAAKGHNLKVSSEVLDPDRRVENDHKVRYSLVYEYTPIAFVQLRAGTRKFGGIPQNAVDNRRQSFIELHAFF